MSEEGELIVKLGIPNTPSQVNDIRAFDVIENMASASFVGGRELAQVHVAGRAGMNKHIHKTVDRLIKGGRTKDLRGALKTVIDQKRAYFDRYTAGLYNTLDDIVPPKPGKVRETLDTGILNPKTGKNIVRIVHKDVMIPPVRTEEFYKTVAKVYRQEKAGLKEVSDILKQVEDKPGRWTFHDAHRLKADLFSRAQTLQGTAHQRVISLANAVDEAMKQAAKEAGPEAYKRYKAIGQIYRIGEETFQQELVKRIADKQSDVIADFLKTAEPLQVRTMRRLIGDDKLWSNVQNSYVGRMISESTIPIKQEVLPTVARGAPRPPSIVNEINPIALLNKIQNAKTSGVWKEFASLSTSSSKRKFAHLEKSTRALMDMISSQGDKAGGMVMAVNAGWGWIQFHHGSGYWRCQRPWENQAVVAEFFYNTWWPCCPLQVSI